MGIDMKGKVGGIQDTFVILPTAFTPTSDTNAWCLFQDHFSSAPKPAEGPRIRFSSNTNSGVSPRIHKLSVQPLKRAPTSCASFESQGGTSD